MHLKVKDIVQDEMFIWYDRISLFLHRTIPISTHLRTKQKEQSETVNVSHHSWVKKGNCTRWVLWESLYFLAYYLWQSKMKFTVCDCRAGWIHRYQVALNSSFRKIEINIFSHLKHFQLFKNTFLSSFKIWQKYSI